MEAEFDFQATKDYSAYCDVVRRMSFVEKMRIVNRLWAAKRKGIKCMLRQEHPEWSDARLEWETGCEISEGAMNAIPEDCRPKSD